MPDNMGLEQDGGTQERIMGRLVEARLPLPVEQAEFRGLLDDARDEKPLQDFLVRHPALLLRLLPPGAPVLLYDRPRLGAEYVPDILVCVTNSQGSQWTCIELESPTHRALIASGRMSAGLADAVRQIGDWRNWLSENVAYARMELGLKGISSDIAAWIIIGRRTQLNVQQQKRYASLNQMGFTVLSYDRLLDA